VPSVDDLHSRVVRQLDRPDASLGEVGQCIAREPGLSTKVLQLVNSAVFGLPQMVADPTHATVLLGLDVIRTLVLSIRVFEAVPDSSVEGLTAAAVWRHSVAVARLAKRIALAEGRDEYVAECAFLGGLLHDIGKLVLAANLPERYLSVRKLGNGHCARTCGVERKVFGGSHGEVGAYLIGLWGFPDSVLEAIAWHHAPSRCVHEPFSPLTSVHVANTLLACPDPAAHGCLDHDYLARAGIAERIPAWQRMAEEALEKEAVV
jgi:putative nucleotidyltransferase with HDIG domain